MSKTSSCIYINIYKLLIIILYSRASLEGNIPLIPYSTQITKPEEIFTQSKVIPNSDLFVTAQIFADCKPLTIPVTTSYIAFKSIRKWSEWLTLPINYSQLPFSSQLAITVWEYSGPKNKVPYGGTTIPLFDQKDGTLKRGRQKLKLWLGQKADGFTHSVTNSMYDEIGEMDRLEKLIKKHEAGDMVTLEWLDNLAFRRIEQINSSEGHNSGNFLLIDLLQFDMPIVFSDHKYSKLSKLYSMVPPTNDTYDSFISNQKNLDLPNDDESLITIYDPEQFYDNPIETKYRKLERVQQNSSLVREIKPNAKMRDYLNSILNYSPIQELKESEKSTIWKFRYYLSRDKRGLTKYLKSVSWDNEQEVTQACELLPLWTEIDLADALELLGPTYRNITVRAYAVNRLKKASDDELQLYLLQLVQALNFERSHLDTDNTIVDIAAALNGLDINNTNERNEDNFIGESSSHFKSPLSTFLVSRAVNNEILGNYFYWYVKVETQDKSPGSIFQFTLDNYINTLSSNRVRLLHRQIEFIEMLTSLANKMKTSKESTPKRIEHLKSILSDPKNGLLNFDHPLGIPIDPNIQIIGCFPEESSVFKSAVSPIKITFKKLDGSKYPIMFKSGDDLRQDQLVIQIFTLMDRLLQNENLDLKITPYHILATGATAGTIQFIPNNTMTDVLNDFHGILPYLKHHNPDPNEELGVKSSVMDTFVKSCAGYCVITYILGVGDRHMDNLLIKTDGHFFHADFGYILGRDPNPFPPLMKLPIQIIEGMGGAQSHNYNKFRGYCFTAFTTLRKNSNLILNLLTLMLDSNIPDIKMEPDRAVHKVKEKFCLEMTEEEAIMHFQNLINDSVKAIMPVVFDRLHSLAQYLRT